MAENNKPEANGEQPATPSIRILNQYIRDLSFENIAAQKNLEGADKPAINVGVNLDARKGNQGNFEVILKLTVTAKAGEQNVFLMEVDYAGVFNITGVPDNQMHPLLMIECPRLLFPFVRQIVRDLSVNGGFPPLNVDPIDFVTLYRSEVQRRATEAQAQAQQEPKN